MIIPASVEWTGARAKEIAMADFKKAEAYFNQNKSRRIRESDRLYLAYVQPKMWDGTKIPRASLPIFLALREIEAMLPQVVGALFADDPFFDAEPMPNTTFQQAKATVQLLRHQLRNIGLTSDLTLREIVRRTLKSSLIYGNGIIEWGWIVEKLKRIQWMNVPIPERVIIDDGYGGQVGVPTGKTYDYKHSQVVTDVISRPYVTCIDVNYFYIDPNCSSHNVQDAGYKATKYWKTIQEIKDMASDESAGFNLPTDKQLLELANNKSSSMGDQTKTIQESYRGNSYQPSIDYSADKALSRIELICYQQKHRDVWMLGREHVFYNKTNMYGKLNAQNAFYIDVPGRFEGLSICDLVEGDQKFAETILNARADELSILVHPPIIRKSGTRFASSQYRMKPFAMWEVDDMKDAPIRMEMGNVTAQALTEMDALEVRTQKVTGNSDISVMGMATAGGNSANRTAAGVNAQTGATSVRREYQVENLEDQFMIPLLGNIHFMNQRFLNPGDAIKVLGPQAKDFVIDPLDVMNASIRFTMKASSKMRSRASLQQGLPVFLQSILNPTVMDMAAKFGMMPNFLTISTLLCDAMGLQQQDLYQAMTPQQQQALNQPSPDQQLRSEMQGQREQGTAQRQEASDETKLLITLLTKVLTPDAAHILTGLDVPAKIAAKYEPKQLAGGKK